MAETGLVAQKRKDALQLITGSKESLGKALAKRTDPGIFLRCVANSLDNQPRILDCDHGSILKAVFNCAALALPPDPNLNLAHLVPYGKICQMILGYRGAETLAYRAGTKKIVKREVREDDTLNIEFGDVDEIKHSFDPFKTDEERGKIVGFYMVGWLPSGLCYSEWMPLKAVEKIRDEVKKRAESKGGILGPAWREHFSQMALKTVSKLGCKNLPLPDTTATMQMRQGIALDDLADAGKDQFSVSDDFVDADFKPVEPDAPKSGLDGLTENMKSAKEAKPPAKETEEKKPAPSPPPAGDLGSAEPPDSKAPPQSEDQKEPQKETPQQTSNGGGAANNLGMDGGGFEFGTYPPPHVVASNKRIKKGGILEMTREFSNYLGRTNEATEKHTRDELVEYYELLYDRAKKKFESTK